MNTTTKDVLAKLGLQTRRSAWAYVLPSLGIFGFGMLAGTGVTLLSMPRIRERLQRAAEKARGAKDQTKGQTKDQVADSDHTAGHLQSRGVNGDGRARASANERDLASTSK